MENMLCLDMLCRQTMEVGKEVRVPGLEPGSTAWKAAMLTSTPHTPVPTSRTNQT